MNTKETQTKDQLQAFADFMLEKMQSPSAEFMKSLVEDYMAKDAVQSEWTIMEFRNKSDNGCFYIASNNQYSGAKNEKYGIIPLNSMLHTGMCVKSGHWLIASVKRNSDGEIFTVGDKLTDGDGIINEFILSTDGRRIGVNKSASEGCRCKAWLDQIEKVPPAPSFSLTTEDGVEVTDEFKELYGVFVTDHIKFKYEKRTVKAHQFKNSEMQFYFSTKEARDKFIAENTPMFSISHLRNNNSDKGSERFYMINKVQIEELALHRLIDTHYAKKPFHASKRSS